MKPTFRVVIALVHTGSRLARGDCGTKMSVFAVPPMAGRASVAAAAPARKLRRFMMSDFRYVPEYDRRPFQNACHVVAPCGTLAVAAEWNEWERGECFELVFALQ